MTYNTEGKAGTWLFMAAIDIERALAEAKETSRPHEYKSGFDTTEVEDRMKQAANDGFSVCEDGLEE